MGEAKMSSIEDPTVVCFESFNETKNKREAGAIVILTNAKILRYNLAAQAPGLNESPWRRSP